MENRLIYFSPPAAPAAPGAGPAPAPDSKEALMQSIEKTANLLTNTEAKEKMGALVAVADAAEEGYEQEIMDKVTEAGNLYFDEMKVGAADGAQKAIEQMNNVVFKDVLEKIGGKRFIESAATPGDVELSETEPDTKFGRISKEFQDAKDVFSNPDATTEEKIAAVLKIIDLFKEVISSFKDGSFSESYASLDEKGRQDKATIRTDLLKQIDDNVDGGGTGVDALIIDKTTKKGVLEGAAGELETRKTAATDAKDTVVATQAELDTEKLKGDTANGAVVGTLTARLAREQEALTKADTELKETEGKIAKLTSELKELNEIKTEMATAATMYEAVLEGYGAPLKDSEIPAFKTLGEKIDDGELNVALIDSVKMEIDINGFEIRSVIKNALIQAGQGGMSNEADTLPVDAFGKVKNSIAFTTAFAKLMQKMGDMKP